MTNEPIPWKPPGIMAKVSGFLVTFKDWAAAGFPRRSPEWVKEIFETHCQPCEWFDAEGRTPFGSVGTCRRCGCHVSPDGEDMLNAIVMPNKSCPLTPPKWGANIEEKDKTTPQRKVEK